MNKATELRNLTLEALKDEDIDPLFDSLMSSMSEVARHGRIQLLMSETAIMEQAEYYPMGSHTQLTGRTSNALRLKLEEEGITVDITTLGGGNTWLFSWT